MHRLLLVHAPFLFLLFPFPVGRFFLLRNVNPIDSKYSDRHYIHGHGIKTDQRNAIVSRTIDNRKRRYLYVIKPIEHYTNTYVHTHTLALTDGYYKTLTTPKIKSPQQVNKNIWYYRTIIIKLQESLANWQLYQLICICGDILSLYSENETNLYDYKKKIWMQW